MTAEPCRAKDRPLHSPSNLFRPLRNPPRTLENASRALVEAPGTAPGSEELISTPFIAIAAQGGSSNIARRRDFQRPGTGQTSDAPVHNVHGVVCEAGFS